MVALLVLVLLFSVVAKRLAAKSDSDVAYSVST